MSAISSSPPSSPAVSSGPIRPAPDPTAGGKPISVPTAGNHRPGFQKGVTPDGPRSGIQKTELPHGMDKLPLGVNSSRGQANQGGIAPVPAKFGGKGKPASDVVARGTNTAPAPAPAPPAPKPGAPAMKSGAPAKKPGGHGSSPANGAKASPGAKSPPPRATVD